MDNRDNFYKTAERMDGDAQSLYNDERWFNCCYLSGYVAECYTKLVLSKILTYEDVKKFSHQLTKLGRELLNKFNDLMTVGNVPSAFLHDLKHLCPTVCIGHQKWDPKKRYHDGNGLWEKNTAEKYREEIAALFKIIVRMKISGVIQ